ncbi:MAG: zinc ribbon domain-containing protein [Lutibacter sp.]|nr:zinc ribbon domain-containing protein [Lutibacter sp.]
MSYCSNCGTNIPLKAKFCPSCGTEIILKTAKEYLTGYKEKMYKNTVMSLKNEGRYFAESKVKEALSSFTKSPTNISEKTQSISEVFKPNKKVETNQTESISKTGGITIWTWIYLIINALLVYLGYRIDTILGTLFFSTVVLLFVFLRRHKPNPYNWLVKIILLLQIVYLILLLPDGVILYLGINTLLLLGLFITDFILLFKGNKK